MNLNESKDSDKLDSKKELKILLIGDCQVGKTCLSLKYFNNNRQTKADSFNQFNQTIDSECIHNSEFDTYKLNSTGSLYEYSPTTLSVYKCDIKINSADYSLSLTDTSGCRHNEKFHQLRKHYYSIQKDIDVIMMCFSLVDTVSFSNISKKWYPEIRSSYPDVPILLIGTKLDLKHKIKYQKKHASKKSSTITDDNQPTQHQQQLFQSPINTPGLVINNKVASESFVNDLTDGIAQTIDNTAAIINNKLATNSTKCSFKKKSFKSCNYCSGIDQKSRSSKSSFLSTLTNRQIETRARAVSIISKVSQQHTVLMPQTTQLPLDPIDQQTKLLENIHESNANLIAILNEDNYDENNNINNHYDDELARYEIDEYGVLDDEAFDVDYFKNLDDDCLCPEYDTNNNNNNNNNINDFNSYKLDQLDHLNENNNSNSNKANIEEINCQKNISTNSNASVKTLILDTNEQLTNESLIKPFINQLKVSSKEIDSECDMTQLKTTPTTTKSETLLIKRRDCLKLKQSMNARKYLECSCLDDISVKIVMDTAIELALEYHLNKINKLSKQISNCSKQTTQSTLNKNSNSIFKYSSLIGSLITKDSSMSANSNLNSSNPCSSNQTKEFSIFSLNRVKTKQIISNETHILSTKSCDEDELNKKRFSIKSANDLNVTTDNNSISSSKRTIKTATKSSKSKPDRQLSLRCLSCTRGINDTSTSLNKI